MIDVHAHLADPAFDGDRDEVVCRARQAGVDRVVVVAESEEEVPRVLAACAAHAPVLRPALGLHPVRPDPGEAERVVAAIRREAGALAAIGEVGLDHWTVQDGEARARQREILARFAALSLELDLPLNVHSRSAGRETIALLLQCGARRVVLHAFDGRAATAGPAVEAGWFFSVPPSVVRSRQKQKLVARLPLSCLLLESDSPALAAEPGARNEPAQVLRACRAVAELHGVGEEDVAAATTANARRLFGARLGL